MSSSDGQLAGGMQMSATEGAITRRPAHPMDTISGGPIGPSDSFTSKEVLKAALPPGHWWWNAAPLGRKPRWIARPVVDAFNHNGQFTKTWKK